MDLLIAELTNAIGLEKVTILLTLIMQHLNNRAHELFHDIRKEISEPRRQTIKMYVFAITAMTLTFDF